MAVTSDKPKRRATRVTRPTANELIMEKLIELGGQLGDAVGEIRDLNHKFQDLHTRFSVMETHAVFGEFDEIKRRLNKLEVAESERNGVRKAMEVWPKYLGWVAAGVMAVAQFVFYRMKNGE